MLTEFFLGKPEVEETNERARGGCEDNIKMDL
jgi:hypothetical protein